MINFMPRKYQSLISNDSHPLWVFVQQGIGKGVVSIKFLLLARLLGPNAVGIISIALIILAIIEGVTDWGLVHAVIQTKKQLEARKYHIVWTWQLIRGILISALLCFSSYFIVLIKTDYPLTILLLLAVLPIVKGLASPGILKASRDLKFKQLALIQIFTTIFDFVLTMTLIIIYKNAIVVIVSMMISEFFKTIISYFFFPINPVISFSFHHIRDLLSFGKWILGNNILTLLNNQLDKLYTTIFLGTSQLGVYQLSFKITQLGIAEPASAFSQYSFPKLSHEFRKNPDNHYKLFLNYLRLIILLSVSTMFWLWVNMSIIINTILGNRWREAVFISKLLLINMAIGSIMGVLIPFVRSIGKPKIGVIATSIQLASFSLLGYFGVRHYSLSGLVIAIIVSISLSFVYTLWKINEITNLFTKKSLVYFFKCLLIVLLIPIFESLNNNLLSFIGSSIVYFSIVVSIFIKRDKLLFRRKIVKSFLSK
ncbi:oligosaccharide flippase family protein [Geobacillus zalihae]|uniref:oligosaccharide flippase family protein n=1 Tax=Geobacillus zalihae TaxID=213419 RepID=UPI001681096C|nr:oligosaccharide flippase family protein [Geobacillus zalihae]QNU23481.1 oligosaccharide flippase family protein [Geobacillus zalihae]